jgi:serine-type D-Ala-D-Ala carboxypeptidase/endopeptidase
MKGTDRLKLVTIIVAALIVPAIAACAQNVTGAAADLPTAGVDSVVVSAATTYMDRPQAVGLSIGVYLDGKTYTHYFGTSRRGEEKRPDGRTLYPIASITKTFTGTLLAQAAIEHRVSLDDDVRKYLDGAYPNLEFQGHPIELGELVNHNSGLPFNLPDIPENRPPFPTPVSPAAQELMKGYNRKRFLSDLHKVQLDRIPGEKFSYSNAAAVLASIVLEKVYGMPYDQIIKTKICDPLTMSDTAVSLNRYQRRRLATGYDGSGNPVPGPLEMLLGAGGLKSTLDDMLKYTQWEMAESDEAVKLTHEPRFRLSDNFAVGMNWQMLTSGGIRRVWQEGNLPGAVSMCMLFPELKLALVVLANEDDPDSSHALGLMENQIVRDLDPRTAPVVF